MSLAINFCLLKNQLFTFVVNINIILDLNSVQMFKLLNVVQKLQSSISRESISCQGQFAVLFPQSITMI